ncbi:MAG: Rrf2 family transcriptional regulator [Gemmatimonadota bacterium]|nr:Rrf2 family transcriptional regulator [Gemmatimonadota bacterium]
MRITTQAEYGLICALHLARRLGDTPVTGREIAASERLPADYVEQIMLKLRRADIVVSTRGARGGYRLSRAPEAITVRDVISASEHSTFDIHCVSHPVEAARCAESHDCSIRPVWELLQRRIDEVLDSVRLSDLLLQESEVRERVGLEPPVRAGSRRLALPVLQG